MSYPAIPPPDTVRENTTPQVDNHPDDHNIINDSVGDVFNELGDNPKGAYADVEARLDKVMHLDSADNTQLPEQSVNGPIRVEGWIKGDAEFEVGNGAGEKIKFSETDGAVSLVVNDTTILSVHNGLMSLFQSGTEVATFDPQSSGDLAIKMLNTGRLRFYTVDGDMLLTTVGGDLILNQGKIIVQQDGVDTGSLDPQTDGDFQISALTDGNLNLVATDGNVRLRGEGVGGDVRAHSGITGYTTILTPGEWTALTPLNGWVTFSGRQQAMYRTNGDEVQVRFDLKNGTITNGTVLFTVPGEINNELNLPISAPMLTDTTQAPRVQLVPNGGNTDVQLWNIGGNSEIGAYLNYSTRA